MKTRWTEGLLDFRDAYSVRKNVFVIEQQIDEKFEIDEYDEIAMHLTIYLKGIPVATGRLFEQNDYFVIGRICVIKKYRNRELGKLLLEKLVERAISMGAEELRLSSQVYATGFYRKFGFEEYGDTYNDAGIEHISMIRKVERI